MFKRLRAWLDRDTAGLWTVVNPAGVALSEPLPRLDAIKAAERRAGLDWAWMLSHGYVCRPAP